MDAILVSRTDGVATITLNRPDRLNALTGEHFEQLGEVLEQLAADRDTSVVVLTGAGRGFCAGGDLAVIHGQQPATDSADSTSQGRRDDLEATMGRLTRIAVLLHTMPAITIAAVNGPCAGAGLSLACACDLRIAAASSIFKTAFLSAGLSGDYGGTWTLPRLVGHGMARHLYLTDERIDARTALAIGLVGEVVEDAELTTRVETLTARLRAAPAGVTAAIKGNLLDSETLSQVEHLQRENARFADVMSGLPRGLDARGSVTP